MEWELGVEGRERWVWVMLPEGDRQDRRQAVRVLKRKGKVPKTKPLFFKLA